MLHRVDAGAQRVLDAYGPAGLGAELRDGLVVGAEDFEAVAPVGLHVITRRVRVRERVLRRDRAVNARETDARGAAEGAAAFLEAVFVEELHQRSRELHRRRFLRAVEQHGEFIAAEPREFIAGPELVAQRTGRVHQQPVARLMIERVEIGRAHV